MIVSCFSLDVDVEKVYGTFTKQQYESAVMKFIQNNYDKIINPMLNARNEHGKKLHTAQSAIAEYKEKLMKHLK